MSGVIETYMDLGSGSCETGQKPGLIATVSRCQDSESGRFSQSTLDKLDDDRVEHRSLGTPNGVWKGSGVFNGPAETSMDRRSPYVPQFSASSSLMVLSRMRGGEFHDNFAPKPYADSASLTPANCDDEYDAIYATNSCSSRGKQLASTMPVPEAKDHPPSGVHQSAIQATRLPQQGTKRKRNAKSGSFDLSHNTIAFPTLTWQYAGDLRGRSDSAPSSRACARCNGMEETQRNHLFRCMNCLELWHQQCCSPAISLEAMKLDTWRCESCATDLEKQGTTRNPSSQSQRPEIENLRLRQLSLLPQDVVLPKMDLIGFTPGSASREAVCIYHAAPSNLFFWKCAWEVTPKPSFSLTRRLLVHGVFLQQEKD